MTPQDMGTVFRINCPECDWESREFTELSEELAAKVDAELHWEEEHFGKIPDRVNFGHHQCPQCLDLRGLDGTVSCSECGYIMESHRA